MGCGRSRAEALEVGAADVDAACQLLPTVLQAADDLAASEAAALLGGCADLQSSLVELYRGLHHNASRALHCCQRLAPLLSERPLSPGTGAEWEAAAAMMEVAAGGGAVAQGLLDELLEIETDADRHRSTAAELAAIARRGRGRPARDDGGREMTGVLAAPRERARHRSTADSGDG